MYLPSNAIWRKHLVAGNFEQFVRVFPLELLHLMCSLRTHFINVLDCAIQDFSSNNLFALHGSVDSQANKQMGYLIR